MDNRLSYVSGRRNASVSSVRISRRRGFQRVHPAGHILTPKGTAHNYQLEVSVSGQPDLKSGVLMNIRDVDLLMEEALYELPDDIGSTELLAQYLFAKLSIPVRGRGLELCKLRLIEHPDYWVDVWP